MMTATVATLAEQFPADRYEISGGVAILDEYTRADGTKIGHAELQSIVEANNHAIEDTGDYVPLTLGHTPDDEGSTQPPVVGFAGPFKLSRIGKVNPRWAIIAENWIIDKNHADEARKHPRRSVELWFDGETKKPTRIDPIALLGAMAPRRSLGLKLSAKGDRTFYRECYEMGGEKKPPKDEAVNQGGQSGTPPAAAATVPAGNPVTGLPAPVAAPQNPQPATGDDALVAKILAAIEQTDWLTWTRTKMAEDAASAAVENQAALQAKQQQAECGQNPNDPNNPNQPNPGMNAPGAGQGGGVPNDEDEGMSNQTLPGGNGNGDDGKGVKEKNQATAAEVDKLKAENGDFRDKLAAMSARVEQLEKDKLKAQRECKLRDMIDSGIQFDLKEELADVDKMSAEEFDRHCKTIEKLAPRIPIGHDLPAPRVDKLSANGSKGKDRAAIIERAKEIALADTNPGDGIEKMKRATKAAEAEFAAKA